jgi:hypothetical protein
LLGFWKQRGAERGFSMVNLWWIAGETLVSCPSFFGLGKHATFSGFIFDRFPLWELGRQASPELSASLSS